MTFLSMGFSWGFSLPNRWGCGYGFACFVSFDALLGIPGLKFFRCNPSRLLLHEVLILMLVKVWVSGGIHGFLLVSHFGGSLFGVR